jgi:diguanylate cyclase (GGDEF)-like protein/PAS domain S-box-containing protein
MGIEEEQYKTILDNLSDGVYFVDRERRINYWNNGAERITGFKQGRIIGKRCMDNILNHVTENGTLLCLNGCPLHATMQDGHPREAEVYLHHADGHRVPVLVRTSPIRNEAGEIVGAVESFSDNTALLHTRKKVSRLEQTVLLDPLTGIGNRRFIEMRMQSALSEFQQHRIPLATLFIDIDHFKDVNDRQGHTIGDRVLCMIADTLQINIRKDDTVARWGGEEFVVLLAGVDREDAVNAAEKLRVLIETSTLPLGSQEVRVSVSIGVATARFEDDQASLLRRADQNMYQSKLAGRNRVSGDPPPQDPIPS